MESRGFVKLHRTFTESKLWLAEPFTRGQAWLDLIALANHRTRHIRVSGILTKVERGAVAYSERTLANRWQWSRGKLRRFFNELKEKAAITRKTVPETVPATVPAKSHVSGLIYITNYDLYNGDGTRVAPRNGTLTRSREKEDTASSADKSASPSCPHEKIIALFHETCPMLPRVRVWTNKRRGHLQARWREDSERQELGWWKDFFAYVARSNFLTGQVQTGDRRPFVADLPWIIEPEHFVKILEGKYE
ncbi:MAG TPA: hypothetical protein DCZ04_01635 [Syntrophorhabdus aromaticivorans]|nr:hypothetical protein [Syntrophorhabdus aromaticivorans]